jgi:hypothetical protein
MTNKAEPNPELNELPTYEMLIRWQIASDYLNQLETGEQVGAAALRTLIDRDFPLLLVALRNPRFAVTSSGKMPSVAVQHA